MKKLFTLFALVAIAAGAMAQAQAKATQATAQTATQATHEGHEYVDLGLTSGTLWATYNVGATAPEEAGGYYAWGETDTKSMYTTNNYTLGTYNPNGANYGMNKYTSSDGLKTLEDNDDAAIVQWGGRWRMPTQEEMQELLDECTWTWTSKPSSMGSMSGYTVTGPNESTIFLPATGYRTIMGSAGASMGYYCSSLVNEANVSQAQGLYFSIDGKEAKAHARYYGYAVRAVQPAIKYTLTVTADKGGTTTGSGTYIANRPATITATPDEHYVFTGWSDGNQDNPRTITVTGDATYTATFALTQHTLTLRATNGAITGAESGKKYDYGTVLTLTATPNEGYEFTGWRDGNQDNPRTITVTEDATYVITFALTQHTLTLAAENGTIAGAESGKKYDYGTTLTLTATPNEGYAFAGWSDGNQDNPRTFTVTQDSTFTATFAAFEYVDLGLPSGTLWATFNVGATSPEQYGDYFAWGEITTKETYKWNTYKYCNGSGDTQTKYCTNSSYGTVDNKTVLDPEDDAAHVNWGGAWRMPTTAEQQELLNECTWEWTDNYNNTGVAGRIVTGTNGNSIFLPAAGYRFASSLTNAGSYGYYWSSSLYESGSNSGAYIFNLGSENHYTNGGSRCYGRSVRPVQSPVKHTITVTAGEGGTATGSGEYFANRTATLKATPNENYVFVGWSDGNKDNPRTITVTQDLTLTATFAQPEYVDLGLPSGTLWATFNVGAASPEQAGDYLAWGETKPQENNDYSKWNYKWYNGKMIKYNYADGKTVLEAEDDAATVNWGGDWRMPTRAEVRELLDSCTWTWTNNYNGTGVAGRTVTGKNGNAIFLPVAGYRDGTSLGDAGHGYYWSSSLGEMPDYAYYFNFSYGVHGMENNNRPCGSSVRPVQSPVKYTLTVTASEGGTATGTGEYFAGRTATLTATPNEGYAFAGWSDGNQENPRTFTVTEDSTFTATFAAFEYVDLGLPSGTLWATFNVGATSPEQAGDYFAWGETKPKEWYNGIYEGEYKWGVYNSGDTNHGMTKYNKTDGKTVLEAEDDAAHVNWGGDWRMPTTAEQQELLNECTWEWTDNYNDTGVAGRIVTGTNGNSIFLPAAGYRENLKLLSAGSCGYYWSSSLDESSSSYAYYLFFYSIYYSQEIKHRYIGFTVRAVQSPVKHTITVTASEGGTVTGAGEYFAGRTATLTATPNEGYVFACWTDESGKLISSQATYTVTVTSDATYTANFAQPAYVDLGLPSGTLWATFNVGATSPEEYGGYFAWGETTTKSKYSWSTYKHGSAYDKLTKYCNSSSYGKDGFTDNKTVLDPEDDVAAVNWGGNWRMPTNAEQEELFNECDWHWDSKKKGYTVTSKKDATKSIFIPAAGYRSDSGLNGAGVNGRYWSSSLYESDPCKAYFQILVQFGYSGLEFMYRFEGRSVRPVQSKKGILTGVETLSHSVSVEVRKVLEDGVIYILRGDEKYMIDGRRVE